MEDAQVLNVTCKAHWISLVVLLVVVLVAFTDRKSGTCVADKPDSHQGRGESGHRTCGWVLKHMILTLGKY